MLKILLWIVVVLVAAGGIMALVGAFLPRNHVASVRVRLAAAPAAIWPYISTPDRFPAWRKDVTKLEMLPLHDGHLAWRETTSNGVISYEISAMEPDKRLITTITDKSLPFGGEWEHQLMADGTGSVIMTTERGFVSNVLFRFLSRFAFGYTSGLETYQHALATALGEPNATVTVVSTGK